MPAFDWQTQAAIGNEDDRCFEKVSGKPLGSHVETLVFEICADDYEDNDVEDLPFITLHLE